ncbi:putative caffeine synthase 2 [Penicillium digitatum]|uniref:Uncharacterized protein n=3 Tax=Penicillium digitatum TaxID=36651 RepID=K9GEU3_PEND2|nr:hypothetical protein PDIP_13020 [Penicillium digitatum Pd1]EKV19722.1 hypothetical protein PDIG_01690 [Penicillium digitatum PHI26]EKV20779.1 hypothetical protein PDIP_13020 [Penicillium digitatum Pd1]QQK44809.1 putative caffeine synthase 2 [Penicillium digitatum]
MPSLQQLSIASKESIGLLPVANPPDCSVPCLEVLDNDVPMQGGGFYNKNSELQYAAMQRALPLFDSTLRQSTTPVVISVVEYGCAQGANSIEPFQRVLSAIFFKRPAADTISNEVNLIFTDRVGNDFTMVANTMNNTQWFPTTRPGPKIFTSMVAQSFYKRVVPTRSVYLGFSLATLHHLERYPTLNMSDGKEGSESNEEQALLKEQADRDLCKFLHLRAEEFRSDGTLVLSLVGQSSTGTPNYPGLVKSCREAMVSLVTENRIPPDVAKAFRVPTYDRSLEDVETSLEKLQDLWRVEHIFEEEIIHPAYETLVTMQPGSDSARASVDYANTVVNWIIAVISGYFVKALDVAGVNDPVEQKNFLEAWSSLTKQTFLREHRNEKVACSFIYVKLVRI